MELLTDLFPVDYVDGAVGIIGGKARIGIGAHEVRKLAWKDVFIIIENDIVCRCLVCHEPCVNFNASLASFFRINQKVCRSDTIDCPGQLPVDPHLP